MVNLILNDETFSGDAKIAEKVGIKAAIVHTYLCFRIAENICCEAKENLHDGKYWCEETLIEIADGIGMGFTVKIVRESLQKLIDANLIVKSKFNASRGDHTSAYHIPRDVLVKHYLPVARWITEAEEKVGESLYMPRKEKVRYNGWMV